MKIFEVNHLFKLTDTFCDEFKTAPVDWGPLGLITYKRTYARDLPDGEVEEWWQTVRRVVEGIYTVQLNHCKHLRLPWNPLKAQASAREMYRRMFSFKFLPAGRSLYSMGTDVIWLRGAMNLYNCAMVSTRDINYNFTDPFTWLMDLSMCGVGVSFDTEGADKVLIREPKRSDEVYVVDDSKEGWCKSVEVVLNAFSGKSDLPGKIDFSNIREKGKPLVTSGGIAPGPEPLILCIDELTKLLTSYSGRKLDSIGIVDVMNIIGKAVVSGGKRRTAEMALGKLNDKAYINMKNPDLFREELDSHRWASNNSIYAEQGMDYSRIGEIVAKNGEPGFIYLDKLREFGRLKDERGQHDMEVMGVNPCGEIGLPDHGLCNLVETFPSRHESLDDFKKTLKYAYLYGKSVTLIPTHCERTNQVIMRQRRIGLSQSGIIEAVKKLGMHEYLTWCDTGYDYLKQLDLEYSNWLCIPRSIKMTAIKPSGTISLLPGVQPGIHYPHSEYYIRRIRIDDTSPLIKILERAGYELEKSKCGDNTLIASFPVKSEHFMEGKEHVSMWKQLELGAKLQYYWADNSISQTVTVRPDELSQIPAALEFYEDRLKTISFLPLKNNTYEQAPYEEISEERYIELSQKIKPLRFKKTQVHDQEEKYCDGEGCLLNVKSTEKNK